VSTYLLSDISYGNQWYLNNTLINGATNQSYTPIQNGIYTVMITDSNGCTSTSSPYHLLSTGTNYLSPQTFVNISPNPAVNNFNVSYYLPSSNYQLQIIDITGRLVYKENLKGIEGTKTISISSLDNGIYFWQVISNRDLLDKGKIVILK
jgi:hypothetical protein